MVIGDIIGMFISTLKRRTNSKPLHTTPPRMPNSHVSRRITNLPAMNPEIKGVIIKNTIIERNGVPKTRFISNRRTMLAKESPAREPKSDRNP